MEFTVKMKLFFEVAERRDRDALFKILGKHVKLGLTLLLTDGKPMKPSLILILNSIQ